MVAADGEIGWRQATAAHDRGARYLSHTLEPDVP
jgi:hypothetical protein